MLKLFVENAKRADAVTKIGWCIDKKDLDELEKRSIQDPHILLSIVKRSDSDDFEHWKEKERKLIPLDSMMDYINFDRPGTHTIYAVIVWSVGKNTRERKKVLRKFYLDTSYAYNRRSPYKHEILDPNGEIDEKTLNAYHHDSFGSIHGSIDVEVGKEFFAKEPSEWQKWWVNLWFQSSPRDQCAFRKRKWFLAYHIQAVAMSLFVVLSGLAQIVSGLLIVLLFGMRPKHINFKAIIHPFTPYYNFSHMFGDEITGVFWQSADGVDRSNIAFTVPFTPIIPLVIFLVSFLLFKAGLLITALITAAVVLVASVVFGLWGDALGDFLDRFSKETEEDRQRRQRELEQAYLLYQQDIACRGVNIVPSLANLPKHRRTFYLRFMDFKAQRCRPFVH